MKLKRSPFFVGEGKKRESKKGSRRPQHQDCQKGRQIASLAILDFLGVN